MGSAAPELPSGVAARHFARALLAIFAVALGLRLGFVAWAPGIPGADAFFYDQYARLMAGGTGYVNLDGSPAIRWMPGWPVLLAGLYAVFGAHAKVGMAANAVFDAGAAALLAVLARRLFDARAGVAAGAVYALWPGMIYYSATLFSESLANLLLVATLAAAAQAGTATRQRTALAAGTGLALGLAAWVKAEPLILGPAIALFLWRVRESRADFVRNTLLVAIVATAVVTPWAIRNYVVFDRFLPTSASGGVGVQLANRSGATGGQDFAANRALQERYRGANSARTTLKRNDAGWGDAWEFARQHPAEQLGIVVNKFRITYGGDSQALKTSRGSGPPASWHISGFAWRALSRLADVWWFVALGLAAAGAVRLRGARRGSAVLVLAPIVVYWALHVPFLGGQRYHVPEIPSYALLVGLLLAGLSQGRPVRDD